MLLEVPEPVWEYIDRELCVMGAIGDRHRRPADRRRQRRRQQSESGIELRGRSLDQAERADETTRHRFDPEIGKFSTARCVCAPHSASRARGVRHAVVLQAELRAEADAPLSILPSPCGPSLIFAFVADPEHTAVTV